MALRFLMDLVAGVEKRLLRRVELLKVLLLRRSRLGHEQLLLGRLRLLVVFHANAAHVVVCACIVMR